MVGMKLSKCHKVVYPQENNTSATWQHTLTSTIINLIVSKSFSAN